MFVSKPFFNFLIFFASVVSFTSAQNDPISDNIEFTQSFARLRGRRPSASSQATSEPQEISRIAPGIVRNAVSAPTHVKINIPNLHETIQPEYQAPVIHHNPVVPQVQDELFATGSNVENDPFLRELFKEFVSQYRQLTVEDPIISEPVTTPTPRATPLPRTQPVAQQVAYIPTPNFVKSEHVTPQRVQNTQIRRRKPTAGPTTASTVNEGKAPLRQKYFGVNSRRQETTKRIVSTTTPTTLKEERVSLRQKYFGVNTQRQEPTENKMVQPGIRRQKFSGVTPKRNSEIENKNVFDSHVNNIVAYSKHNLESTGNNNLRSDSKIEPETVVVASPTVEEIPVNIKATPSEHLTKFFNSRVVNPRVNLSQKEVRAENKPQKTVRAEENTEDTDEFDEKEFRRQAENANYEFASAIDDNINGHTHDREEVRDGLAVKGKYSFSDGYFMRTIHYEADDKGYRVVKELVVPLDGPQKYNPQGDARVSQYMGGNTHGYQITGDDIKKKKQTVQFQPLAEDLVDEDYTNFQ